MNLSGKHVLLTGGSRGLGPVMAEALARRGAHLALAARSEEGLRDTCTALRAYDVRTLAVPVDLTSAAGRERLVSRVLDEFGRIDLLINNAGVEIEGAFSDLSWEQIQETIEVNLSAPMHLTRLVLPHMLARSEGHVIHLSSLAGKVGLPYGTVYSGTKAALARWSEGLRREIAGQGVQVSCIFPGYVLERGMFARFGVQPPWLIGSSTPTDVTAAVMRAVERGAPEVIVNSMPLRPLIALAELSPRLGDWLMDRLGGVEFQRRKVGAPPSSRKP